MVSYGFRADAVEGLSTMSSAIEALQALREQAWIPTPLGDKFSLHFDDTLYLQLVAQHILDRALIHTHNHPGIQELKAQYEQ